MTATEIINGMPERILPGVLEGLQTMFHFDITGEGGGHFTVRVTDGKCTVQDGLHGEPNCKVTSNAENFVGIVTGKVNAPMALMMGKIKVSNLPEMMKFAKLFGMMPG